MRCIAISHSFRSFFNDWSESSWNILLKKRKFRRNKSSKERMFKDKDHPAVKQANRTTVKEIKKAKRNFEKKLAQNIKQDSKSFLADR